MILLNGLMVVISAAALFSLRLMRTTFRPIEKFVYYMIIVTAIEQLHSALTDNMKLIKYSESLPAFVFYKMNQLIVFPLATLWLLYSIFRPNVRIWLRALFLASWFIGLSMAFVLFERLDIMKWTGWNFGHSIVMWYVVLIESLCFSAMFRRLLGRSDDDVPSTA